MDESDAKILKLIDEAEKTAATMNRELRLDERKLSLFGATPSLVETLRDRNRIKSQRDAPHSVEHQSA